MYSLTLCIRKEERLKINCLAISRCCWNNRKSHLQTKNNKANKHKLRQGKRSYIISLWIQFSSVQSLSRVRLFATPWTTACRASLSITNSCSLPKFMSIESVMSSTISSSVVPFSSCPQSLSTSGSFPMSQLFTWGGQSIGVSASASVLPMNTQDWWTGWISMQSNGLSRVFSNTTVQKHQFFNAQLSSQSNSHIHTWPLEKP